MRAIKNSILMIASVFALVSAAFGVEELRVGEVTIPNLRWGQQRAIFELTNLTEDLKFIVITCEIRFGGSYVEANRSIRNSYILEPLESQIMRPTIYIPGSYGSAKATVSVYDVVDTLDALLDKDRVFEQPILLNYGIPDGIAPYMQEKVALPPFVDVHPEWDNEISRAMLVLFREGKSCGEIADLAMADTAFIESLAERMVKTSVLMTKEKGYKPQFPVILASEAEEEKKLADKLSDSLVGLITRNLPAYEKTLRALELSNAISADTSGFMNPGAVMYQKYPMIGAFLLWYELGRSFITRSAPLAIYNGTDLCNAVIPFYMYAVVGGDFFHGHQFYSYKGDGSVLQVNWGDRIPTVQCEEGYVSKRLTNQISLWNFTSGYVPEPFMIDTAVVHLGIKSLAQGSEPLMTSTYNELKEIATRHGHEKVSFGHRYWFWNLVATRTVDQLIKGKVIERRGNGQFHFELMAAQ